MAKKTFPRKILIDCDPGQDDAVMLFLAFAAPEELDILGITTVAGNVPLAKTERNARLLCDVADVGHVPVYAGCDQPMVNKLRTAEQVHGNEGIDGMEIRPPQTLLQSAHAVDFLVETLKEAERDSITLVPTGPLTNVARAIERDPTILPKISEIVIMGGARSEGGNITPSAEFNIFVDPHAAKIVFDCGRPLTVFGLDVTHQVRTSEQDLERIGALGNNVADAVQGMLGFYGRGARNQTRLKGAPLHDPCTIAYLLKPEIFKLRACNVRVETESALTMGHTAVDFWGVTSEPKNVQWAYKAQADMFFDLLIDHLARY